MLKPFQVDRFGGLDLRADPEESGARLASDLLNVTFNRDGRLTTRDGYQTRYSGPAGVTNLWPLNSEAVMACFGENSVKAIQLYDSNVSASASITAQVSSFASFGSAIYFTDGAFAQVKKFSSGSFTSPAGLAGVQGRFLAVQPRDNRLVVAGLTRVSFSDPDDPETFGPDNYVDLIGDNEQITGMAVHGTNLIVFKKTKFYVFYGNSVDRDGEPVFNYRPVASGVGCWQTTGDNWILTATHRSGVYFVAQDGIYRTTGAEPVRISDPIGPIFKGTNLPVPPEFLLDPAPLELWCFLGIAADRLYACGGIFSNAGTYVLDLITGQWTAYDWGATAILDGALVASGTDTNGYRGAVVLGTNADIALSNRSHTTDNGTPISWRHRSGYFDLGNPAEKKVRYTDIYGSGTATAQLLTRGGRPADVDDPGSQVTLGTAPAIARTRRARSARGRMFAHKLSGSGPAVVSSLEHWFTPSPRTP